MAQIVSIVYKPHGIDPRPEDRYARVPLEAATLVAGHGIEGDRKGGKGDRNLNLMSATALGRLAGEGYQTGPGQMGEQIVLGGLDVDTLAPGTRLRLGDEAVIEVVKARTGCSRLEHIQKHTKAEAAGRLGVMARVVAGGLIRVGDAVEST